MNLFPEDLKIDDLGRAVKLFKESRDGFLKLFDNSPVCMSMTTTSLGKRVYVRVNRKFLEKFGFDEQEVIGRTSVEIGILDENESLKVAGIIREKGRLQNDYVKCRAKNGEIVHTVSSIEHMDLDGQTFLVSFFVDISKIIEQQTIIEQHAQELEAVNKDLEAFSYSVSHDLRAPLRAIDGYAKTLEEDFYSLLDDEGKKILSAVQRNTRKMGTLIDDLLAFARLGKLPLNKSDIDMNALVNDVLADLRKSNSYKSEIKIGTLKSVKGDYALMRQVLENLIGNALKYSSKKENAMVEISSSEEAGGVAFTVRDNGDGFDMKYAHKLFGVFQRLHKTQEFEGTGVGLAIVHRIITKHGGTIIGEGERGKGATFTFVLPKAPDN